MALLLMLIALPTAMMAQSSSERYMIITGNDGTFTVFDFDEIESVTWKVQGPQPLAGSFGTGKATINGNEVDVPWIQLWENGPRIAKYNVGVTDGKVESLGGLYCWGKSIDKDPSHAKGGTHNLTGNEDTATNLWGSNWRMPTGSDLEAFCANCDGVWTNDYKGTKISGMIFTGKGKYSNNSVFLPAAGWWLKKNEVDNQGTHGFYWSSTCSNSSTPILEVNSQGHQMYTVSPYYNNDGYSVRAIYEPHGTSGNE